MFRVGYCPCCGGQSQVTDEKRRPISHHAGSKLCWLCICDEQDNVITRVGTFALCPKCKVSEVDPEEVKESLVTSKFSGITGDEPEWGMGHHLKLELIQEFGV